MKMEDVKDLIRMASPSIPLLQETKIEEECLLSLSKKKWKTNFGKVVSARGTASGIATLWPQNLFSLLSSHATQHWIFIEIHNSISKTTLSLFNLYVPVNYHEERDCWNSLSAFLSTNSFSNIIAAGDLNIILDAKEKKGGQWERSHDKLS